MTQIFFFSEIGNAILQDPVFRSMANWHAWGGEGSLGVDKFYGVALPYHNVHPNDVVNWLTDAGIHVLPSVHDKETDPHTKFLDVLSKHGVKNGDKAHDIAKKMHEATGMPLLKPHLF
jgi:hypothetical protein